MSEANSWTTMRKHIVAWPGRVHVQRFEDKLTGGIPDTNVCWSGADFWMEGKFLRDLPKRADTLVKIGLRDDQSLWLETRQRAGGNCFVWLRIADFGWYLFNDRFRDLYNGIPKSEFLNFPRHATAKDLVFELREHFEVKW